MPSYGDRCLLLSLQTLEHRHKVNQSVFVSKLVNIELNASTQL